MRQLIDKVFYSRYQALFYLWWMKPVLKFWKITKYYEQNYRSIVRISHASKKIFNLITNIMFGTNLAESKLLISEWTFVKSYKGTIGRKCMLSKVSFLSVCSCHVTYTFQSESTLYSCLFRFFLPFYLFCFFLLWFFCPF